MGNDMYLRENEKVVLQAVMHRNITQIFYLIFTLAFIGMPAFAAVMILTTGGPWFVLFFLIPFLAVGVGFLIAFIKNIGIGKHISLILTEQRVFIYDKKQKGYLNLEFNEINSWKHYNPSVTVNGVPQYNSRFTFITDKGVYTARGIENYYQMCDALNGVMLSKCANPMTHSMTGHTYSINRNFKIIIDKLGYDKYQTMQVIKNFTGEDLSVIDATLSKLPCIVAENFDRNIADQMIMQLNNLGNNAYKVN